MADQEQTPTEAWNGVVRYYGELASRPDWKWMRPIFELAKQISTSQFSIAFLPSILDEGLEFSPEGGSGSRQFLRVTLTHDGRFFLQQGTRGETSVAEHCCSVEAGFPTIAKILRDL